MWKQELIEIDDSTALIWKRELFFIIKIAEMKLSIWGLPRYEYISVPMLQRTSEA